MANPPRDYQCPLDVSGAEPSPDYLGRVADRDRIWGEVVDTTEADATMVPVPMCTPGNTIV
jgi:hypothetical protein